MSATVAFTGTESDIPADKLPNVEGQSVHSQALSGTDLDAQYNVDNDTMGFPEFQNFVSACGAAWTMESHAVVRQIQLWCAAYLNQPQMGERTYTP